MIYNDINPRPKYYIIIEYDNDSEANIVLKRESALVTQNIKTLEEITSVEALENAFKYLVQREEKILEAGDNIHAYYKITAYIAGECYKLWTREGRAINAR